MKSYLLQKLGEKNFILAPFPFLHHAPKSSKSMINTTSTSNSM